jgi:hypothetical protein
VEVAAIEVLVAAAEDEVAIEDVVDAADEEVASAAEVVVAADVEVVLAADEVVCASEPALEVVACWSLSHIRSPSESRQHSSPTCM